MPIADGFFSGPFLTPVKAWVSTGNQALDALRTLAMVLAVMASRSDAR
jgi:hypothetical protein